MGAIPTDAPHEVMRMKAEPIQIDGKWIEQWDDYLSIYYHGRWRNLDHIKTGDRFLWSTLPITPPSEKPND